MHIKQIRIFITTVLIILLVLITIIVIINTKTNTMIDIICVPTEDVAISIGKIICENAYPEFDYSNYEWKAFYWSNEDVWQVGCTPIEKSPTLGGGMPQIFIRKSDAKILDIGLQA